MKICGLSIDFPEIDGYTSRQIWYAEKLREEYVSMHMDRFEEIDRLSNLEADKRIVFDGGDYQNDYPDYTFDIKFTDEEAVVLFSDVAGGIIATLKPSRSEW